MSGDIKELSVEEIEKRIEEQLKKEQEHKNTLDKMRDDDVNGVSIIKCYTLECFFYKMIN